VPRLPRQAARRHSVSRSPIRRHADCPWVSEQLFGKPRIIGARRHRLGEQNATRVGPEVVSELSERIDQRQLLRGLIRSCKPLLDFLSSSP
jgi:hypothetical protein